MEPLLVGVSLVGFILTWVRIAHYMIDNPPRYIGEDDE